MPSAFNDSSNALYQGELFGALRIKNGAQIGGFISFGDTDEFKISPKQKFVDIEESQTGLGLTTDHIPVTTELHVEMNILNSKFDNWMKAIWGTYGGAVTGATVTGETVKLYPGAYCPLEHPGISAVTLTAGVIDVDYIIDPVNGGIQVLANSVVFVNPVGTSVDVNYTFADYAGKVEAFTAHQPIFMLRLNGFNTANSSQPVIVNVYQWASDMAKMLSMIDKKKSTFMLNGMLLQDTTKPRPTQAAPFSQFFNVVKG